MAAAQGRQLQLVSTAWSPFTNAPGQARFALDLVGVALERVGITAETVIVDEARLTPLLLSGEVDGSAALWQDTERERALIYSQPYLENRLILVGRQGSDVSATSLAGLAGKRIALVAGYAYGEGVETTDGPTYVGSDSEEDSVVKLLNGEVDYTLMDDLVVQYLINNHGEEARTRLAFGSAPLLITLASPHCPPVPSGRRVDHFPVQCRVARHDRRRQLPSLAPARLDSSGR